MTKDKTDFDLDETDPTDQLDDLFASLRETAPHPDEALMARVLADAFHAQDTTIVEAAPAALPWPGRVRAALHTIGGWPSLAGLVTAGLAGVWIGLAPPDFLVQGPAQTLWGGAEELVLDLDPALGFDDVEEGL